MIATVLSIAAALLGVILSNLVPVKYEMLVLTLPCLLTTFFVHAYGHSMLAYVFMYLPVFAVYSGCLVFEEYHHDYLSRAIILLVFLILVLLYWKYMSIAFST